MAKIFPAASDMGLGEAGITAVFGYAVVFLGLLILMILLYIMAAVFKAKAKKSENAAPAEKKAADSPAKVPAVPLAPGSAGNVKLFDVPDKEAAMVMAVVAYKMQKPLNELRFISIKEVKSDEI